MMTEHCVEAELKQIPPNGDVFWEAQRGGSGGWRWGETVRCDRRMHYAAAS